MAILQILLYPDPLLKKIAAPITKVDGKITELANSMFETMYDAPGIGLAGPQVGIMQRIFVIDIGDPKNKDSKNPIVFINPEIKETSGERKYEEGCLSLPGIREMVVRPSEVVVKALDIEGKEFTLKTDGLLATAIQHELDHLNGILFTDHLKGLKKKLATKKLEKLANDS